MIRALVGGDARISTAPLQSDLILITGPVASGKSDALAQRFSALSAANDIAPEAVLVASSHADGARDLAARVARRLDGAARTAFVCAPFAGITLDVLALAIVADGALAGGLAPDLELVDSDEIAEIFERAAAPLFSAEWAEYLGADIDPEISGLRTPDRFADAVLRLIVKLRDAGITPESMLAQSLRGAATFYGKPPNFADPGLLMATKDEYRSSLLVAPAELERQRRREIDLAKIVAKLYRSYIDELVKHGCLTAGDAVAEATRLLGEQPPLATQYRARLAFALVDDAHDLRSGEVRLLQALFGTKLRGVTFAGTLTSAIRSFAGARADVTFKLASTTIELPPGTLVPPAIAACAAAIGTGTANAWRGGATGAVRVHRAPDRADEIAFVAQSIAALVAAGTPAERIALVHRSARCLSAYEDALVDANVPVALHGDIDLLARPEAGDALAALWVAVDPYRHAWLLRALELPMLALGDATLGVLCGEPANPQAMLFALPEAEPDGDRRWDRRRDVRLAMNVLRGERDAELPALARERVNAFRERRSAWAEHARDAGTTAARAIVEDAGLLTARAGEAAARAARREFIVDATLALIDRYERRHPGGALEDALEMLARIAPAERGPLVHAAAGTGVFVGSIDCFGPRRFDHVFIVDARAGSFPPYYVPDAFLFSPAQGMVPKDAAGDAPAGRTAKFTWYSHHAKLNAAYAREHRRLLALAMLRADVSVTVTASGRATRGIGAPEFAAELQAMLS
ncbi:MAG TPA: UvrD-helicase domain-containing protein [Candidatus Lustribacter sp.]|nr:UvrD-helicase domain-containing protein [Candidatus Lustribacter sp.]